MRRCGTAVTWRTNWRETFIFCVLDEKLASRIGRENSNTKEHTCTTVKIERTFRVCGEPEILQMQTRTILWLRLWLLPLLLLLGIGVGKAAVVLDDGAGNHPRNVFLSRSRSLQG